MTNNHGNGPAGAPAEVAGVSAPITQRIVLVVILLITLLVAYVDRVNVSVLVTDGLFLDAMGITGQPVSIGLLMTAFLIAYGVSNVFIAPLGDVIGPRKAMTLSILLWGIALLLGGVATTFAFMIVSRVSLGIGEGMQWPMQSKYVKNWFSPAQRGKANAVWLVGLMVGPAVAMPFFTWIIHTLGWRPTFFVLASIGLVPLVLLWFFTTDHPRQNRWISSAERDAIEAGLKAELEAEAAVAAQSVGGSVKAFVGNYRFWLLTVFYACFASVWWGTMTWLPSYLKDARGFSWAAMGAWASLPYCLGTVNVILFGWLSDKVGRRAPFAALSMLGAAAGIYFGAHAPDNNTAAILLSLGIASIAIGLPSVWTLLQQIVPGRAVGAGAGMMNGVANGGSALAPVAIGFFISVTGGFMGGLMFLVALTLVGFACMSVLAFQKY
ncbi:MAG: MFS transporter [Deltaproteobacteria bacterium]|nr:MFS transporter [Deltaproteobacteria bacterium]